MKIFAHRGLWETQAEQNSLIAIERAFDQGFDLETDLRYWKGQFVIKHDEPLPSENLPRIEDVLNILDKYPDRYLALHFKFADWKKADSLAITDTLAPFADRIFLFDMSLPYCLKIKQRNPSIKVGVSVGDKKYHDGFSNLEDALNSPIDMIWADEFRHFYTRELIETVHQYNKLFFCISPDLAQPVGHPKSKTGYQQTWDDIIGWRGDGICTDHPKQLKEKFQAMVNV